MPGLPPKATKLHLIHGTGRPDRHSKRLREPQPKGPLGGPPSWLMPSAKRLWREIEQSYGGDAEVLTRLDRTVLATYVQMWSRWQASERARPYVPMPASYIATMASIAGKLGLNPSDRAETGSETESGAGTGMGPQPDEHRGDRPRPAGARHLWPGEP
jgi:phage terminase small subunit